MKAHASPYDSRADKIKICDSYHRILAERIEPLVWQDVKAFLTDRKLAQTLLASAEKKPKDDLHAGEKRLVAALNSHARLRRAPARA